MLTVKATCAMAKKNSRPPFKLIKDAPAMRERLHELTGNELKVWMYFWLRTAGELTTFPGNETIARELGMGVDTVKDAKRALRTKGWTSREAQRRRDDGTLSTVTEKIHLPWGEKASTEEATVEGKSPHGTVVVKTDDGKTHQQKEYSVSLEVLPSLSPSAQAPVDSDKTFEVQQQVSESVSQSSSAAAEVDAPLIRVATPQAQVVLKTLYPASIPENLQGADLHALNTITIRYPNTDWEAFFTWQRSHKPSPLVFRALPQFLSGIEYSLNDFANHNAAKCSKCKLEAKASAQPGANPKNPNCDRCKGPTYGSPQWEDDKPYCAACMKLPYYRRHSGEREITGRGVLDTTVAADSFTPEEVAYEIAEEKKAAAANGRATYFNADDI